MSKAFTISLVLVTLLVGGIAGFTLGGANIEPVVGPDAAKMTTKEEASKTTGLYTDQSFLEEMIAHHESAVSMSKQVLAHTSRKEIRQMGTDIIETQTKEIEQMKRWLEEWK